MLLSLQVTAVHRKEIRKGLGAQLPLILVFAAFFLLTAETWEITVDPDQGRWWQFWALVVTLLMVSGILLTLDALRVIRNAREFDSDSLRKALDEKDSGLDEVPDTIDEQLHNVGRVDKPLRLTPRRWANALFIVLYAQAAIFVPVLLIAAVAFWAIAVLSVSPDVATTWIGGDDPRPPISADWLLDLGWFESPWVRVPILLAVFSLLERVVRIVTDDDQHSRVIGASERALRLRFAVAFVLDEVSGPTLPSSG
jgi:hypothetical protein